MNQCLPSSHELVKQFAWRLPLPNEDLETPTQMENSTNVLIYVFLAKGTKNVKNSLEKPTEGWFVDEFRDTLLC